MQTKVRLDKFSLRTWFLHFWNAENHTKNFLISKLCAEVKTRCEISSFLTLVVSDCFVTNCELNDYFQG